MCEDDEKKAREMQPPRIQDLLLLAKNHKPDLWPRLIERYGNMPLPISLYTSLILRPNECSNCGSGSEAWIKCEKCGSRQYCSYQCKNSHWEHHRVVCSWPHGRNQEDWPYDVEGPWKVKMDNSPEYEYVTAHKSSCRNSKATDLPAVLGQQEYARMLKNGCGGQGWLITTFLVVCMALERYECDNEPCRERKKWLDEKAPFCSWSPFRELVLTCLSCQIESPARSLSILYDCMPFQWEDSQEYNRIRRFPCLDIHGAIDLLRWVGLSSSIPGGSDLWDDRPRPQGYDLKPEPFLQTCQDLDLCPSRLWNITLQSHGAVDVRPLVDMIKTFPKSKGDKHIRCTEQVCLLSHENSFLVQQAHKCDNMSCGSETQFPLDAPNQAYNGSDLHSWAQTAWSIQRPKALCDPQDPYVAISHVWSDGTGAGVKGPGRVNECLYQFFANATKQLGCSGVWWDTISLPTGRGVRTALNVMLKNYENAACTIIHDNDLAEFEWKDDGTPAVALVLSAWFTRGWTAAELYASRKHPVKVFFKDPSGPGVVLKDLDEEVLVWEPDENITDHIPQRFSRMYSCTNDAHSLVLPRLGHLIASRILRKLRPRQVPGRHPHQPNLGQIIRIMKSRTTSWARDSLLIAGLLCLPSFALDSSASGVEITQRLLTSSIHISRYDVLHGEMPMVNRGPWSWCPPSIYDFGKAHSASSEEPEFSVDDCLIDEEGVLLCPGFYATSLNKDDVLFPFSTHPAPVKNINIARLDHRKCVLLAPSRDGHEWILAVPIKIETKERHGRTKKRLSCRWVGCVRGELSLRNPDKMFVDPEIDFDNTSELDPDQVEVLFHDDLEPTHGRKIDKIDVDFGDDLDASGLELEAQFLKPLLHKLRMEPKWKMSKEHRDALLFQMLQQEAGRKVVAATQH